MIDLAFDNVCWPFCMLGVYVAPSNSSFKGSDKRIIFEITPER